MRPAWGERWRAGPGLRLDAWRFAAARADYYDYLQAVLRGMRGQRTLREVFDLDARRYGSGSVRGRLSAAWARACEQSGGDLHATWIGSFPADELTLVRAAQAFGSERLLACFEALSGHLTLMAQARRILALTLGTAVAALVVACLLALALPAVTVPGLARAFHGLPPAFYGPYARMLFTFSDWLAIHGAWLPAGAAILSAGGVWMLPRGVGAWRRVLDGHGVWRLYRQVQGLRILALLEILLGSGPGASTQLRAAIGMLHDGARPWARHHLSHMLVRIDQGWVGAVSLDTGLLDRDAYWYLEDMAAARGLRDGLRAVRLRLAGRLLGRVAHQAQAMRWLMLLAALAWVLGVALWHYAAMDELRRAWMMFHAGH
ncbi:hypothetical protein [Castellaniella sp. GW247-6E4]|uniref:hypothetical protein n=1 Tax=Castellaniella sp. GW247-6E4 TaxID=3140380 RepID=UPI003314A50A